MLTTQCASIIAYPILFFFLKICEAVPGPCTLESKRGFPAGSGSLGLVFSPACMVGAGALALGFVVVWGRFWWGLGCLAWVLGPTCVMGVRSMSFHRGSGESGRARVRLPGEKPTSFTAAHLWCLVCGMVWEFSGWHRLRHVGI